MKGRMRHFDNDWTVFFLLGMLWGQAMRWFL